MVVKTNTVHFAVVMTNEYFMMATNIANDVHNRLLTKAGLV